MLSFEMRYMDVYKNERKEKNRVSIDNKCEKKQFELSSCFR